MLAGQPRQLPEHVVSHGSGRNGVGILKTAVIYGANASGKSNLVRAMDFARKVAVNGIRQEPTQGKHFRLAAANREKPSLFEFEFKIEDKVYAYGFEVLLEARKFCSEWLTEVGKTADKPVFERSVSEGGKSEVRFYQKLDKKAETRFNVYAEDLLENQLFLTELNSKNLKGLKAAEPFESAFHWLEIHLVIFSASSFDFLGLHFSAAEALDPEAYARYFDFFKTGIAQIRTKELPPEQAEQMIAEFGLAAFMDRIRQLPDFHEEAMLPLSFRLNGHKALIAFAKRPDGSVKLAQVTALTKNKDNDQLTEFELQELSDGTQRILDLLPLLITAEHFDYTFVIDEIDRSLHPELSRKLLQSFHRTTQGVESQLVVSTHESSLLDLELLRRDEIWFVEKNESGESKLYSLEEFKPRHDAELRKAYLMGRFGAIPLIADAKSLGWRQPAKTAAA